MRVMWLQNAVRNLDHAANYIARDDPAAALRMAQRVRAAVDLLRDHPTLGKTGRVPGTRELVVPGTPYLVAYRVRRDSVAILRVLHGAQRWPDRL